MELEKLVGIGCFVIGSASFGLGVYHFFKDKTNRYILSNIFSYTWTSEFNKN